MLTLLSDTNAVLRPIQTVEDPTMVGEAPDTELPVLTVIIWGKLGIYLANKNISVVGLGNTFLVDVGIFSFISRFSAKKL